MGHGRVLDHMFLDGLEDAYDKGRLMGTFAEDCARGIISSPAQSRTPTRSPRWRARKRAISEGAFAGEIAPVDGRSGQGARRVSRTTSSR